MSRYWKPRLLTEDGVVWMLADSPTATHYHRRRDCAAFKRARSDVVQVDEASVQANGIRPCQQCFIDVKYESAETARKAFREGTWMRYKDGEDTGKEIW